MNTLEQNVFVSTAPRLNQSHVPARPQQSGLLYFFSNLLSIKKVQRRATQGTRKLARASLNPHKYHLKDVLNTMGRNIYICQQCQEGQKLIVEGYSNQSSYEESPRPIAFVKSRFGPDLV